MTSIEQLTRLFFKLRFHKDPGEDPGYYKEWLQRFKQGNPQVFMDSKSLEVYKNITR